MTKKIKFSLHKDFRRRQHGREIRKALNTAVKKALGELEDDWGFDGRSQAFNFTGNSCETELEFLRPSGHGDEKALYAAVLREVNRIGWQRTGEPAAKPAAEKLPVVAPVSAPEPEEVEIPVVDGKPDLPLDAAEEPVPPLSIDPGDHFAHLIDREAQIELLLSSIKAAVRTDMRKRFHVVLHGRPGCGKTDMLRSVYRMLGPAHCLTLDGPSTTKAGVEQLLMTANRIKPFILIEEIEKMKDLDWLLGILDERAEILLTNARDGQVRREARVLCIATANDMDKFLAVRDGALNSRFPQQIYCPRPDQDTLEKIVMREVLAEGGDPRWVNAAVNYCVVIENDYDPRRAINVCLAGGDDLLDGTYQKALVRNRQLFQESANNQN